MGGKQKEEKTMTRAEQRALEAYPHYTAENLDDVIKARKFFAKGYSQAEKDLALDPLMFLQVLRNSSIFIEHIYMNGGCYQLYKILKSVFPNAKPYISGYPGCAHIATMIDGRLYDIGGEYKTFDGFEPLSPEIEEEAEEWRFEAMNDLYYGECENCGEPVRIDRSKIGKPINKDLALTWEDVQSLCRIEYDMINNDPNDNPNWLKSDMTFYEEVLRRFIKAKEEHNANI